MELILHVDEVDDDDPADVAQAELVGDLLGGLDIGLEDRLVEVVLADKPTGVDVDDGEGLGTLDDDIAAGTEPDLFLDGPIDLDLDAVGFEQGTLTLVQGYPFLQLRGEGADEMEQLVIGGLLVDDQPVDIVGEQVADRTEGDVEVLVDQGRGFRAPGEIPDLVPEEHQKFHVGFEFLHLGVLGDRPDDETGALRSDLLDLFLEDGADFLIFNFARHPDVIGQGDEDQVAAGQGDMAGQSGALGAYRILADLDQHVLALDKKILDIGAMGSPAVDFNGGGRQLVHGRRRFLAEHPLLDILFGDVDIIDVEKTGAFEADVDEGRLHSRQDSDNPAAVDVALETFLHRSLHVEFGQDTIFDKGQSDFIAP